MGKNLYFHLYLFFIHFFIEFFEGVSRGGPYRWSMDRSVRWSVDPVRWTGPRTGGHFGSPVVYFRPAFRPRFGVRYQVFFRASVICEFGV